MNDFTVTFVVSSDSSEKLRLARELAISKSQLDRLHTDVATATDRVRIEHHRLGDYFDSVQVAEDELTSFRLVFYPRPNADRYWKDLIADILVSLRAAGVSIKSARP